MITKKSLLYFCALNFRRFSLIYDFCKSNFHRFGSQNSTNFRWSPNKKRSSVFLQAKFLQNYKTIFTSESLAAYWLFIFRISFHVHKFTLHFLKIPEQSFKSRHMVGLQSMVWGGGALNQKARAIFEQSTMRTKIIAKIEKSIIFN